MLESYHIQKLKLYLRKGGRNKDRTKMNEREIDRQR
jgi:hypothetical protein